MEMNKRTLGLAYLVLISLGVIFFMVAFSTRSWGDDGSGQTQQGLWHTCTLGSVLCYKEKEPYARATQAFMVIALLVIVLDVILTFLRPLGASINLAQIQTAINFTVAGLLFVSVLIHWTGTPYPKAGYSHYLAIFSIFIFTAAAILNIYERRLPGSYIDTIA